MLDSVFGTRKPQRWNVSIGVALERHLAWQQRLLEQTKARGALGKSTSFLLLGLGQKVTYRLRGSVWLLKSSSSPPCSALIAGTVLALYAAFAARMSATRLASCCD